MVTDLRFVAPVRRSNEIQVKRRRGRLRISPGSHSPFSEVSPLQQPQWQPCVRNILYVGLPASLHTDFINNKSGILNRARWNFRTLSVVKMPSHPPRTPNTAQHTQRPFRRKQTIHVIPVNPVAHVSNTLPPVCDPPDTWPSHDTASGLIKIEFSHILTCEIQFLSQI